MCLSLFVCLSKSHIQYVLAVEINKYFVFPNMLPQCVLSSKAIDKRCNIDLEASITTNVRRESDLF